MRHYSLTAIIDPSGHIYVLTPTRPLMVLQPWPFPFDLEFVYSFIFAVMFNFSKPLRPLVVLYCIMLAVNIVFLYMRLNQGIEKAYTQGTPWRICLYNIVACYFPSFAYEWVQVKQVFSKTQLIDTISSTVMHLQSSLHLQPPALAMW